jgi:hypothetical protein
VSVRSFKLNDKGQYLEVVRHGSTLTFSVMLNAHVSRVSVQERYSKEEDAKSAFEAITDDNAKQLMSKLSFCSDFTKQLINGLSKAKQDANTKKTAEFDSRANGSSAYGRHGVRNTASSRAYPQR